MSNPPNIQTGDGSTDLADGAEENESSSDEGGQNDGGEGSENDPSSGGSGSLLNVDRDPLARSTELENASSRLACVSKANYETKTPAYGTMSPADRAGTPEVGA